MRHLVIPIETSTELNESFFCSLRKLNCLNARPSEATSALGVSFEFLGKNEL